MYSTSINKFSLFIVCFLIVVVGFLAWHYAHYVQASPIIHEEKITETSLKHLAIIMDGNRRWARERNLKPWFGHKEGAKILKQTLEFCLQRNIPFLTLYAFSLENLKRSPEELEYLFETFAQELAGQELETMIQRGIRVCFVGDRSKFPDKVTSIIQNVEAKTADCHNMRLTILFCYGGQQEIVAATKSVYDQLKKGIIKEQDITQQTFEDALWTHDLPAPELIIRSGGAQRLSNFLTYKSAYTELYFIKKYWPDITTADLQQALDYFEQCQRNFGT
jgi:undecaprenyl diphosphate synthase